MTDPTKPYQCTVCHKTFVHHSFLKRHEVVHTGERPFECDVCGSRFSQNSGLNEHLRTKHASQTPKSSRNTPRNFNSSTSSQMTDPTRRHECKVCHKTFTRRFALNAHSVVHTGERPFECNVCGSRFSQNSGLNEHLRKIHADQTPKSSRNTPRNLGRNTRKSTKAVLDKSRTVSTQKTNKKQSKAVPKRYRQEEEDSEAMSDVSDRSEQQREVDSDSEVSSNRKTGNRGGRDDDKTEEKPRLMLAAPLSKNSKINTPLIKSTPFPIKIENPIVQEVGDLMPLMDLSTSAFPPLASQQGVFDMDIESEIGNVSNISPINTPQFSFDEDCRQISHQIMRVATNSTKDRQDCFRQLLFATVFAFENSPTCTNVEEFFRMMGERYAKK